MKQGNRHSNPLERQVFDMADSDYKPRHPGKYAAAIAGPKRKPKKGKGKKGNKGNAWRAYVEGK